MAADSRFGGRIAILGSGREGLAAFEYIDDLGTADHLELITEGLSGRAKESELAASGHLRICPFGEAGLEANDLLVRSPGVSPYRDPIQAAMKTGVRITTPSSMWFQAHPDANTIVISGTKGKSTTSALLAHLLAAQGRRVQLAGNIGTPLLTCDDGNVDWWVIELSSFQIADLEGRPTLAVLLNLATDHLDWHGSETRYRSDKLRLANLVESGGLIANGSDPVLREALAGRPDVEWFSSEPGGELLVGADEVVMPVSLPGKHNRANLSACIAIMRRLGCDRRQALAALPSFKGLPHRLQNLGTADGLKFIDDSISTAPVATVAALEALAGEKVVLLAGGFDRGIDWSPYARAMRAHPPAAVIALPDNGPRILAALKEAGVEVELGVVEAENLKVAVELARKLAPAGAVVLLSPGAPSFPHFRNYEDRGIRFAEYVFGGTSDAPPKSRCE